MKNTISGNNIRKSVKKPGLARVLIWGLLFVLIFTAAVQSRALAADGVKDTQNSVVRIVMAIHMPEGMIPAHGTGFCVSTDDGRINIVTNRHVVELSDEKYIEIVNTFGTPPIDVQYYILRDGKVYPVDPSDIIVSASSDLAVIRYKGHIPDVKPVTLGFSSDVAVTDKVYAIGFPGLGDISEPTWNETSVEGYLKKLYPSGISDMTVSEGDVQRKPTVNGYQHIQHSAETSHGNSGGPLISEQGLVIGVNTLIASDAEAASKLQYSIDVDVVKKFLKSKNIKYSETKMILGRISPAQLIGITAVVILLAVIGTRFIREKKQALLEEVEKTAAEVSDRKNPQNTDTLPDVLRKLYSSADSQRLLSDPDYFMDQLSIKYRPEFKNDCKILETASRCGIGKVVLQFYQQHTLPTEEDRKQVVQELCNRCGMPISDAARAMQLYWDMVGWGARIPETPVQTSGSVPSPSPAMTDALQNLYQSSDKARILMDPDYFLEKLAQIYRPEYKLDCQLLEKAARSGLGAIMIQFIYQNTEPSDQDMETIISELGKRSGISRPDAIRMIILYGKMIGWSRF